MECVQSPCSSEGIVHGVNIESNDARICTPLSKLQRKLYPIHTFPINSMNSHDTLILEKRSMIDSNFSRVIIKDFFYITSTMSTLARLN